MWSNSIINSCSMTRKILSEHFTFMDKTLVTLLSMAPYISERVASLRRVRIQWSWCRIQHCFVITSGFMKVANHVKMTRHVITEMPFKVALNKTQSITLPLGRVALLTIGPSCCLLIYICLHRYDSKTRERDFYFIKFEYTNQFNFGVILDEPVVRDRLPTCQIS